MNHDAFRELTPDVLRARGAARRGGLRHLEPARHRQDRVLALRRDARRSAHGVCRLDASSSPSIAKARRRARSIARAGRAARRRRTRSSSCTTRPTTRPCRWSRHCARAHPQIRAVHNQLGRGPALALRAGFAAARGEAVLVTMADASDDPNDIAPMLAKHRARGLRPGRRVALHARRPPARRPAAEGRSCRAPPGARCTGSPACRRATRPAPSSCTARRMLDRLEHRERRRASRSRSRSPSRRSSPAIGSPRSRRRGAIASRASRTSSCCAGCRTTCAGTGWRCARGCGVDGRGLYEHRFDPAERRAKARVWAVLCADFFQRYVRPSRRRARSRRRLLRVHQPHPLRARSTRSTQRRAGRSAGGAGRRRSTAGSRTSSTWLGRRQRRRRVRQQLLRAHARQGPCC